MRKNNTSSSATLFPATAAWGLRPILLLPIILLLLVSCSEDDGPITPPIDTGIAEIEARVNTLINQYRVEQGYAPLSLSSVITTQARQHSKNMASGLVLFGHDGFQQRVDEIKKQLNVGGAGENVAMNSGYTDPAKVAFDGWLKSDGHRANIEGNYDLTGVGVSQSSDGAYYLTQIFVKSR
ncbi:MAG: CAP domain-containing protein [Bacteroidota bacterium]